jgi:hypothetical protein
VLALVIHLVALGLFLLLYAQFIAAAQIVVRRRGDGSTYSLPRTSARSRSRSERSPVRFLA